MELASILKRHVRDGHLTRRDVAATLEEFEEDEHNGVWQWFGVTSALLDKVRDRVLGLPNPVFIRSIDALYLSCAEEHGFREVYTNDLHMLRAAKHFGIAGIDILEE